jgi:hypothetical protein
MCQLPVGILKPRPDQYSMISKQIPVTPSNKEDFVVQKIAAPFSGFFSFLFPYLNYSKFKLAKK